MSERFTPGPWTATAYNEHGGYDCMTGAIWIEPAGDPTRPTIATLDGAHYRQPNCGTIPAEGLARMEANARLIAAAPELYALTVEAARVSCECDDQPGACFPCRSRALLARVQGEG